MKKISKKKPAVKKTTAKKPTAKKTITKKPEKSKTPSVSAAAKQDIVGLLSMLVQKLSSFESKIDIVLSRIPAQPTLAPKSQSPISTPTIAPVPAKPPSSSRPMFKAVCADCGTSCEVPFKPKEDRKVYCKECFSKKKSGSISKTAEAGKPKIEIPVNIPVTEKLKTVKTAISPQKTVLKTSSKKNPAAKNKKVNKK